jgi:hypothetical protein
MAVSSDRFVRFWRLNVAQMRDDLDRLIRDRTLVSLAFAIAVGWSLYQLAHGVAVFFDVLFSTVPGGSQVGTIDTSFGLTWHVGSHVLVFDGIVVGLIELALVLGLAVLVGRRASTANP